MDLDRRLVERGTVVLVCAAAAAVAWFRLPELARGTLWAEDGARFLADQLTPSGSWGLLEPYAGYLHFVPRAVTAVVEGMFSLELHAVAVTAVSCLIAAGVAAMVYVCSADAVAWRPARLTVAAITVLLPLAPLEVSGNLANVHWYFLWLTPWLLLYRPRTLPGAWLLAAVALIGALTEIQLAVFLPLVLWRLRDRRGWPLRGALLLGLAAQLVTTMLQPRAVVDGPRPDLLSIVHGYVLNVAMPLGVPSGVAIGIVVGAVGIVVGYAVVLPFVAAAGIVLWCGERIEKVLAATLLLGSIAVWTAGYVLSSKESVFYSLYVAADYETLQLLRYGVVPGMLLAALIPLAASVIRFGDLRGGAPSPNRTRRLVAAGMCLVTVGVMAVWFAPPATRRDLGPSWGAEVQEARALCHGSPASQEVALALAPPSWKVVLQCADLSR